MFTFTKRMMFIFCCGLLIEILMGFLIFSGTNIFYGIMFTIIALLSTFAQICVIREYVKDEKTSKKGKF